uniref:phage tail protein n=1 Tax=Lactococcus garvieae TaxID=1363 RepID=UPI00359C2136
MYRVIWYEDYADKIGRVIHDFSETAYKLSAGVIKQELGSIPSFTFTVTLSNPCYAKLKPLISLIKVINTRTGKKEFEGRVRKIEHLKMDSSGNFTQAVQCVGYLDYLHDSSQRFKDVSVSNLREYLQTIINRHNQSVQPHKRFRLGEVTVNSNTGNVYRGIGYEDTFDTIKNKLIDRLGGNIILRNQNDEMTIDYVAEYGTKVNQPIKVAKNMIEVAKAMNSDELITRIVPTGAEIEKQANDTSILARERYTISSVNGGKDYLDDDKLIEEFGIIEKSVNWSDTKQPRYLKTKGEQYLRDQRVALVTWGVTTVNLDLLDERYKPFELGNYYPIDNKFISEVTYQQIVEKTIDINQPHKISLVLGSSKQTLSAFQLQFRGFSDELDNAKQNIDNSRKSLEELKAEAQSLREMVDRVPEQEKMLRELEVEIARQEEANKKKQEEIVSLQESQGQLISEQNQKIIEQANMISEQEKRIAALEKKK